MKLLLVTEFGPGSEDHMPVQLADALHARDDNIVVRILHGAFTRYRPGGLGASRLFNLAHMYLSLPWVMATWRPDLVLARTTPPGIQLWAAVLGRLMRVRVGVWLMDYHPELEARMLERRGAAALASLIRRINARLFGWVEFAVVLDTAMAALVRQHAPGVSILRHPTWGRDAGPPPSPIVNVGPSLTLLYCGNLGLVHPTGTFERLVAMLRHRSPVRLLLVGLSPAGERRMSALARRHGIDVVTAPRSSLRTVSQLCARHGVVAGIVLLADEAQGVSSPSKFQSYLQLGVPLLYIGPTGTNAAEACSIHAAGFALDNNASEAALERTCVLLCDNRRHGEMRSRALQAAAHCERFGAATLAALLDREPPALTSR